LASSSFITTGGAAASAVATLVGSIFATLFRVNVFRYYGLALGLSPTLPQTRPAHTATSSLRSSGYRHALVALGRVNVFVPQPGKNCTPWSGK